MTSVALFRGNPIVVALSSIFVLAACSGGGSSGNSGTMTPPPPPPPLPTVTLASDSGRTSLTYMTANVVANDMVWDATHGLIHVVTAATSPANPSSIVSLDPATGLVKAAYSLSGEPKSIALSADAKYVYAGLAKGGGAVRVHASGLAPDISIPVGTATSTVWQIRVSPTTPTTIAVIVDMLAPADGTNPGVELFDNAVLRPTTLHGSVSVPPNSLEVDTTDLHWSADAQTINATMSGNYGGGIATLTVDPGGITATGYEPWPISAVSRIYGTQFYLDDGRVMDFSGPVQQVGKFADYDNAIWARAELLANQKAFSAQNHISIDQYGNPVIDAMTWNAFDVKTFATVDTITFKGLVNAMHGKLISWGTSGLAWADPTGFIIASGSFTASGGAAAQAAAAKLVVSGSFTGTNGAVKYTVLDFGANDVAIDTCNHLYVATSANSDFRPNSVVAYDVPSGTVTGSAYAGSEPHFLATSDDCTAVYAALFYSNSIARLSAPSLAVEAVLPLNGGVNPVFPFMLGRSIAVAPGARNTLAIARAYMQTFACGNGDLGVTIFDDATERPTIYGLNNIYGIKSIAWGLTASTLYGEDQMQALYSLTVDSMGVTGATTLTSAIGDQAEENIGRALYFDRMTSRLYTSLGWGFDTIAGASFGPLALPHPLGVDECGTPLVGVATDPTSGKVFYVDWYEISGPEAFWPVATLDEKTLTLVDSAQSPPITLDYGAPIRAVRLPPDRLVFATNTGYVVIFEGPMLSP